MDRFPDCFGSLANIETRLILSTNLETSIVLTGLWHVMASTILKIIIILLIKIDDKVLVLRLRASVQFTFPQSILITHTLVGRSGLKLHGAAPQEVCILIGKPQLDVV